MHRSLAMLAFAVSLAGCGPADRLTADGAYIRLPAVPGRPGAAYFSVRAAQRNDALTAVTTPVARRTELHESMAGMGGMMSMRPLTAVPLAADTPVAFAPGGRHVMLFDMTPGLQPGSETRMTLTFRSGRTLDLPARVVGAGETPPG